MKETLHYGPADQPEASLVNVNEATTSKFSITGGEYYDPVPKIIERINRKFKEPGENIQAVVMRSFELAGLVRTERDVKDMAKPLEEAGLLPTSMVVDSPPTYLKEHEETSEFTERREEQLLLELQEGNDERNAVLRKVVEMTRLRMTYSPDQVRKLRADIRSYIGDDHQVPPVARTIAVMVGISNPENPETQKLPEVPELTNEMALDVYWMMLREEEESKKNSEIEKEAVNS